MGKGIDLARGNSPEHAAVMDYFKDQLLIVFLKRLCGDGRSIEIPLTEVDDTGDDLIAFSFVNGVFHFELQKKN